MSQGVSESIERRSRLKEALRTAVEGEMITNAEMYGIWGVTKGRWTDIRNRIPGMPEPVQSGNVQMYERTASLKAMWEYETRNDKTAQERAARIAALVGADSHDMSLPTISDMMKANQLRAEIEARMVKQRELVWKADIAATFARMFELLSKRISSLGTIIDPNGALEARYRDAADKAGHDLLLAIHREMSDMLGANAAVGAGTDTGNGGAASRARASQVSKQRRGSRQQPA